MLMRNDSCYVTAEKKHRHHVRIDRSWILGEKVYLKSESNYLKTESENLKTESNYLKTESQYLKTELRYENSKLDVFFSTHQFFFVRYVRYNISLCFCPSKLNGSNNNHTPSYNLFLTRVSQNILTRLQTSDRRLTD